MEEEEIIRNPIKFIQQIFLENLTKENEFFFNDEKISQFFQNILQSKWNHV